MAHLRVDASPETVHWGFFDAALPPVGEVDSGETVTISTVSGTPDVMPRPPLVVPPELAAIHRQVSRKVVPGHICTGPVKVRGAKACGRRGPLFARRCGVCWPVRLWRRRRPRRLLPPSPCTARRRLRRISRPPLTSTPMHRRAAG